MSRRYQQSLPATPDSHCVSCGAGVFNEVPSSKLHLIAYSSSLDGAEYMDVCVMCTQIEAELISASGTRTHPDRLAYYERRDKELNQ